MTIKKLTICTGALLGIVAVFLIFSLIDLSDSERTIQAAHNNRNMSLLLADELQESSRELTSAVQKFAVTGSEHYAEEFINILRIRAGEQARPDYREIAPGEFISLDELMRLADFSEEELSLLSQAAKLSDELTDLEFEAINAVRGRFPDDNGEYTIAGEPDLAKAIELVFSRDYEDEVTRIMKPISLLRQKLDIRLDDTVVQANNKYNRAIHTVSVIFVVIVAMFGIFLLMLRSLINRINLEENARYFDAVISSVDAGVIIKDKDGLITDWNAGAECILGYKPDEIIGRSTKYYAPGEGHDEIDEIQERLKNGEHISHVEVVRMHEDGRLIDCSASYTPIYGDGGKFTGSVAIFHDVTAEKNAVKKAKNMAAIVSAADAGIVVKDTECNILEWNFGAENILGYKAEEIIGRHTKYYVPESGYAEIDEIKARLLKGEHTAHIEVVRKHKDGRLIDCSATYTPVFDDGGVFAGSVAVFQDISEKKRMEDALKEAARAAEEASKAKSSFLANMSHEIRTPMNGVIGFAELALDEDGLSDSVKDCLKKIKFSAGSLLGIINDILDISKIEAGAMELEAIPFSLHDVFRECESISRPKAEEKEVDLHFYAEPYIDGRLVGDPTKLRQVLVNLLSNAIKFTNYGMVKLTAVLSEKNDNTATICFEVRDSGIGMTPEQINKIFDPFAQADNSTTRKYGGTGLGLSITKRLVEMMGSELNLESTIGLGSKFSFAITFNTLSEPLTAPQVNEPLHHWKKPVFEGEILVCEDNTINQEVAVKHLSRLGLTCVVVSNGKLALDAVKKRMETGKPFDLILMDIHMPVMDGLEATKHLLDMGNKTPIIALTANAMSTDKETYLKHGMSDYLSKPYMAEELWTCLARHMKPVRYEMSQESSASRSEASDSVLNEKDGISKSAGDEQLYRRIQKNFRKDNKDVIHRLKEAVKKGDLELAHRIAHTLKGTAGLIGAEKLAQIAGGFECALKDGKTTDFTKRIDALESAIREVFAMLELSSSKAETAAEAGCLDINGAIALIDKISPVLKTGNPESVSFIDEIRTVLAPVGEDCERLIEQIEDFDFDLAYETAQLILGQFRN